jgi:hypothetical protein
LAQCEKGDNDHKRRKPDMSAKQLKKIDPELFNEVYDLGIKAEKRRLYNIRRLAEIRETVRFAIHGRTYNPF